MNTISSIAPPSLDASADISGWEDSKSRLTKALDNDELYLLVQPIQCLADGRFPKAEVLVRLREEETMMLPPGEFLPVFEHYGMLPMLDRWVVSHAIQWLAGHTHDPNVEFEQLTINVSAQTLSDRTFPQFVFESLMENSVESRRIGFEVDEEHLIRMPEDSRRFCKALNYLGIPILIDGFGRHSVTFEPASELRANYLKIDGRVIRKLGKHSLADQKMSVISSLARKFNMQIIAESVEDLGVLEELARLSVDFAQGFGIARPTSLIYHSPVKAAA